MKIASRMFFFKEDKLKRSMFLNTLCKPLSMLLSFLYTPLLLGYLGDESYGIWSTILSVINWINYFDVGIGNGLRNLLAKYIEVGNKNEAKHAVSTGYVALSVISGVVFLLGSILIVLLDINLIFNTNIEIRFVLFTSFMFICMNFILALSKMLLYATQQAEKVGFMTISNQMINLIGIIILSIFSQGSLLAVAILIGLSGVIVNLLFSIEVWKKYIYLIPSSRYFQKSKLNQICNVGIKFFFIQIAALILYSTDNMIITALYGPSYVTPYHTVYMAFGIVNGMFSAMIAPLWSQFTVALENEDFRWMKKTILGLAKFLPAIVLILVIGVLLFRPVSIIWLRKELEYERGLIITMALYYFLTIWGSIYSTALNGMGRVKLQLITGGVSAVVNIPLSVFLGWNCNLGTTGILLATVICMVVSNLIVTIETHIYLERKIKEMV